MKRYAYLITYTASATNTEYAGMKTYYVEGVGTHSLDTTDPYHLARTPEAAIDSCCRWTVKEFGYKTLSGAKRGERVQREMSESENSHGHWIRTYKLIEIPC